MNRRDLLWTVTIALVTMTLFQAYRATFPLVRSLAESTVYIQGGATAIAVFALTMLAGIFGRPIRRPVIMLSLVTIFGVLYLIEVFAGRPTVYVMLATCFFGVVALGSVLSTIKAPRGSLAAGAMFLGGSLDAITKLAWQTWDPIWQSGILAFLWCAVPTVLMVLVAGLLYSTKPDEVTREDLPSRMATAGVGAWMALVFICLGNAPVVASNSGIDMTWSAAVVLLGWTLGMVMLLLSDRLSTGAVAILGVVAGICAIWLPVAHSSLAIALSVIGMALCAPLLAMVLRGVEPRKAIRDLPSAGALMVGLGLGVFAFTVTQFLYQIHYAMNLPVWNNWVLLIPVLILVGCALKGPGRPQNDAAPAALVAVPAVGTVAVPAFLALTAPAITSTPNDVVRLTNYNVHEGVSNNGPDAPTVGLDLEAIAQTIEAENPNTVTVQEIGRGWAMSGYTDIGLWLQRRLKMNFAYGPAADNQFGNGVYSSMPMETAQTIDLGQGTGPMKRSAAGAALTSTFGTVWAWSVHLQHNEQNGTFNDADRIAQIDTWLKGKQGADNTIVAGDFNAEPGSKPLSEMTKAGFTNGQYDSGVVVSGNNVEITYQGPQSSDDPAEWEKHLDYIFATKDLKFTSFGIGDSQASDHRPLFATIVQAQ